MAASSLLDVCRFNPTLGGTTDWTYSSAVTGYQSPAAAGVVNGAQYSYRAESADLSQWEIGTGTYNTSTGVLSRAAVLFNSSGGTSKITFGSVPQVAIVALKEDLGTVTSVAAGTGLSGGTITGSGTLAVSLTNLSATLGSDTPMSASTWTTGASVAQGTGGTWLVTGHITIVDTAGSQLLRARITDGTTIFASAAGVNFNSPNGITLSLSAIVASPAGSLSIDGFDPVATGVIKFNYSGQSKDTRINAVRIG